MENTVLRNAVIEVMNLPDDEQVYQGIPFGSTAAIASDLIGPVAIDSAVRTANSLLIRNALWIDGCGGSAVTASACRGARLRQVIARTGFDGFQPQYALSAHDAELVAAEAAEALPTAYPFGLRLPSFLLAPLPIPMGATKGDTMAVVPKMEARDVLNPLVRRQELAPSEVDEAGVLHDNFEVSDARAVVTAFGGDMEKIASAVERLVEHTVQGSSDAFAAKPYWRSVVIPLLLKQSGATSPLTLCCGTGVDMTSPAATPLINLLGLDGDSRLVPFKEFCLPCHAGPPLPLFMKGSDVDILAALRTGDRAKDIFDRLNWESDPPPDAPMPPSGTTQQKRLRLPENAAKRVQMQVLMQQFML